MLDDEDIAIATAKGWSISPAKTQNAPIVITEQSQIPKNKYQINSRLYDFSQYSGGFKPNESTYFGSSLRCFEGDFSSSTNLSRMFHSTSNLTSVNITGTENVIDMSQMFYNCTGNNFSFSISNTSKVVNMREMFRGCSNLLKADLTG
jgi:hypothetical protein